MRTVNLRMLDLLRVNQQKAEFVGTAYGTELSITETFTLVELDIDPTRTSKLIADLLGLDKSTVSRAIVSLAKRQYLHVELSKEDLRKHDVSLTRRGKEFLALHDAANERQLASWSSNVTVDELAELQNCLRIFADGCGANPVRLRPKESILLIEMRRLTRAFGLLSPSFSGSGYSATIWQILSEIEYAATSRRSIDLCKLFLMKPNTLSQILTRLEKTRLISKKRLSTDKRNFSLTLTSKGKEALQEIESCASKLIDRGLARMSSEQIERFLSLFGRYIGVGQQIGDSALQSSLKAERLISAEQRQHARTFLVYHYVRTNRFTDVPEILAGANGFVFALRCAEKLAAVCEIQQNADHYTLANMAVAPEFENSSLIEPFLLQSKRSVLEQCGDCAILIPRSSIATQFLSAQTRGSELPGYLEFLD